MLIKNIIYLCCFLGFFFISCSAKIGKKHLSENPIHYVSPNRIYARDSQYLAYTIQQFSNLGVVGYGYDIHRVDIDTIVYSPDSLKLFAFVIDYAKADNELNYDGHAILGYRFKTNSPWIVYPVTVIVFAGYTNYNMVRNSLKNAYFKNFSNPAVSGIWNYRNKRFESYPSYNVIDPKFWGNSYIWMKDVSVPGYYEFQFAGGGVLDSGSVLKIPPIHYPDSLLNLYYENK